MISLVRAVLSHQEEERRRLISSSPADVARCPDNWEPRYRNQNTRVLPEHSAPSRAVDDTPRVDAAAWRQRPEAG